MKHDPFNTKLVQAVKKYPCLYNYKLPEYSRKDITDVAWSKVAEEVKETVPQCKEKWKNLRTVFVRKLRPSCTGTGRMTKPYYLSEIMQFIVPYVKLTSNADHPKNIPSPPKSEEQTDDEITNNEDVTEDDIEQDSSSSKDLEIVQENAREPSIQMENRGIKRKSHISDYDKSFIEFVQSRKCNKTDVNPRKMFLLSLLPEINEMTEAQMKKFKRKVLELIDEISSDDCTHILS
ncbi:uncharacterized protein LOC111624252 [Centruroides sculpturatus]|uniref:uncharacterized protein LOC111624247 n=1 Tax=Centruroides sculpturatus TaxID=218467 RepID=UPI000C6CD91A|nr:uncharacterized protein LOC111624247 [Centruroides sculpturatus]XP_023222832.1 uncharacterized protein LOC111624252 [Centruroides sculpturatus]